MSTATLEQPTVTTPTPTVPERTNLQVTDAELRAMTRGVDYTGRLEMTTQAQVYVWHRERPGEMQEIQAYLDTGTKAGTVFFDVTGGIQHAGKVRQVTPDTEELIGVSPLVGG